MDLGGREDLLARLTRFAADPVAPACVLVTHHPEELPPGTSHVLLLRGGRALTAGPVAEVLTSENLSAAFGFPLTVQRHDDRWYAQAAH
jgi:iron complex transport system ATP-binding protein